MNLFKFKFQFDFAHKKQYLILKLTLVLHDKIFSETKVVVTSQTYSVALNLFTHACFLQQHASYLDFLLMVF